jgi:hypothetical protein
MAAQHDDPEMSAQSFVERSQHVAEEHLKALTAEAEQLRARLAKLDSGIKKWQNLLSALKAAQHGQTVTALPESGAEEPRILEPIAQGSTAARADKRVRWASAPATAPGANPQTLPTAEPGVAPPLVSQPAAPAQAATAAPR